MTLVPNCAMTANFMRLSKFSTSRKKSKLESITTTACPDSLSSACDRRASQECMRVVSTCWSHDAKSFARVQYCAHSVTCGCAQRVGRENAESVLRVCHKLDSMSADRNECINQTRAFRPEPRQTASRSMGIGGAPAVMMKVDRRAVALHKILMRNSQQQRTKRKGNCDIIILSRNDETQNHHNN